MLENGSYSLEVNFYLTQDGVLTKTYPIFQTDIDFEIEFKNGYGIEIDEISKDTNIRDDQIQIISSNDNVSKQIKLNYKNGNLGQGSYIVVKTYKRRQDGQFVYLDCGQISIDQDIVEVSYDGVLDFEVTFPSSLDDGTYRVEFELLDNLGISLANTYTNFLVLRN